jgi:CRISPR-associated protein Csx3
MLARALHSVGEHAQAQALETQAQTILGDFQRLLVVDGVVCGYMHFGSGAPQRLLHPSDAITGVRYSLLPMVHAILGELFTLQQAHEHLALIETHLLGPDGARLFDRPLPYRGGPASLFQRAETSACFGREIGVMYVHAHLRYAEMLAHLGLAERFFDALCRVHPIGVVERIASADLRQSNCYFSSSDAAFADRYEAHRDYARVAQGTVALDGGWRIYSSGPGIAIGVWVGRFLGLRAEHQRWVIDPVLPPSLSGLRAWVQVSGQTLEVLYRVGPRGHGPTRLVLNGQELVFDREANAYRCGGATVARAEWTRRWGAGHNRLEVDVG